jgi:hypothetical protein
MPLALVLRVQCNISNCESARVNSFDVRGFTMSRSRFDPSKMLFLDPVA